MTGSELFIPVRNSFSGKDPGFSELDKSLKRCFQAIEDWADSPFVSSAHIQNAAITNAHIADATIDAAKITNLSADKITSGTLNAEILLASKMRTGNAGSRRVELDAAGVRLHEDDDSVVVNLPTDTDQPAYFAGTVVASDLILSGSSTVSDQLTVDINGGIVNVAAAASDPASSPVVNTSTASTSFGVGASGTSRRGLYWDGSNYLFLTDGYLGAANAYLNVVNSAGVLQASHQVSWGSIYTAYGGWVRIGSLYYLLGARSKEASSDFYQIEVYEIVNGFLSRRGSQQLPTTYNATEVAHREGALTSDGTDLFAVVYNMNTGQFDVLRYTVSGYGMTHHSTVAHSIPASTSDVTAFYRGSGDLGGARNIFQIDGSTHYYVYNTSGVRQTSEEWDGQGFDGEGLTYRSGTFYEISTTEDKLYQYGSATGFASSTYWIAYTWYDADATGGTHESALSPRVPFTGAPRKALQVTWPTIPDGGGTDDPNSVRLYLKLATSDPGAAFGSYFRQGTTYADTTTTLLSYSTSTAGSQDTVFPNSGSPGQIVSGLGGFTVKGDGTLILPVFTSDPSGGVEGQIYFNSNTNKFTGYDGTSWVALH